MLKKIQSATFKVNVNQNFSKDNKISAGKFGRPVI